VQNTGRQCESCRHYLENYEPPKLSVVTLAHAAAHPPAVVVEANDADVALVAVTSFRRSKNIA